MNTEVFTANEREMLLRLVEELRRKNDETIPDVLLTNTETARYLGVSLATVGLMIAQGRISRHTKGKVTGIRLIDAVNIRNQKHKRREV